MDEIEPPISEVVSWVLGVWEKNTSAEIPFEEITEHIRELFHVRKNFWWGITNSMVTEGELRSGLSQHVQT